MFNVIEKKIHAILGFGMSMLNFDKYLIHLKQYIYSLNKNFVNSMDKTQIWGDIYF